MSRMLLMVLVTLTSVILVAASFHSAAKSAHYNFQETPTPASTPTPSPSPSPSATPTPVPEPEPVPSPTATPFERVATNNK